jgi:hypothetical protein
MAAAVLAGAALMPAGAVAQPAEQTNLSLSGQADYIAPFHIDVYATVQGTGGFGNLFVSVQQPFPPFGTTFGNGNTQVICDGQRRTYAVAVFGSGPFPGPGFQLGEASAFASVFCPTSGSDEESRTIRITKP